MSKHTPRILHRATLLTTDRVGRERADDHLADDVWDHAFIEAVEDAYCEVADHARQERKDTP